MGFYLAVEKLLFLSYAQVISRAMLCQVKNSIITTKDWIGHGLSAGATAQSAVSGIRQCQSDAP